MELRRRRAQSRAGSGRLCAARPVAHTLLPPPTTPATTPTMRSTRYAAALLCVALLAARGAAAGEFDGGVGRRVRASAGVARPLSGRGRRRGIHRDWVGSAGRCGG